MSYVLHESEGAGVTSVAGGSVVLSAMFTKRGINLLELYPY